MYGKAGQDKSISVPIGTVVINVQTDGVIGDMVRHGDRLTGGLRSTGGLGNMHFKSSINRAHTKQGLESRAKSVP